MTDELDALKAALRAPTPDPQARAEALRLAMENFDRLQGSTDPLRPTADRPSKAGFAGGLIEMLKGLKTKHILAATTSVAAVLVGVAVLPALMQKPPRTLPAAPPEVIVVTPDQLQDALTPAPKKKAGETANSLPKAAPQAAEDGVQALAEPTADRELEPQQAAPMPVAPMPMAEGAREQSARQRVTDGVFAASPTDSTAEVATFAPQTTEAFANATANPLKITAEEPVSTFSIDVDTASYAVVRSR